MIFLNVKMNVVNTFWKLYIIYYFIYYILNSSRRLLFYYLIKLKNCTKLKNWCLL